MRLYLFGWYHCGEDWREFHEVILLLAEEEIGKESFFSTHYFIYVYN